MFATVEEAEKAAAMLRRFASREVRVSSPPISSAPLVVSFPGGGGQGWPLRSWDEVAEHIEWLAEDHDPQEDRRAGLLKDAGDWLRVARETDPDLPQERTQALINTVARLLEVLA